ncbi:MAG: adenylyltransferase/cytidyltransferase family protein [Burkholderiales bacterium]|nr:adenylyltransferase/cytidyltransferase family protein [Burkholderiales bacterium]
MTRTVITYGTFDLFHIGHLRLLQRLHAMGDMLIVAVSTDEFNAIKGKKTTIRFDDRCDIVRNLRCVDLVIPERNWAQKPTDILNYEVSLFGMGSDWTGKFDELRRYCEVIYLPRTEGVSSTQIKQSVCALTPT